MLVRNNSCICAAGAGRQPVSKKATLGNVMTNMMRHKRLENLGARPQVGF